jgi:hypothetical protein
MTGDGRKASGLFLALLAIMAQLTLAVVVPASVVSLENATVLCQHDTTAPTPHAPPHQLPDCSLCFLCHSASAPAGLTTGPPMLPAPRSLLVARAAVPPPATAPPPRFVNAANPPRGPPIQA